MADAFYVTTPIYYVNDVPAHRPRLHDGRGRRPRPAGAGCCGDDVFFLTGTDEHGLKLQRAAEANGLARRSWSTDTSASSARRGTLLDIAYDDFIRTTEPRHHRAVQQFLQTIYDNGDIELGIYEGLYCVACEAYYTEEELIDGSARSTAAGRAGHRGELLLPALALRRPAARALRRASRGRAARVAAQRGARLHQSGPPRLLDEPDLDQLGRAAAVGPEARRLCVVRRVVQLLHRGRATAPTRERFAQYWPVDYHLVGKDILRFHAVYWPAMLMAAGLEPPQVRVRARLAARRRREDVARRA